MAPATRTIASGPSALGPTLSMARARGYPLGNMIMKHFEETISRLSSPPPCFVTLNHTYLLLQGPLLVLNVPGLEQCGWPGPGPWGSGSCGNKRLAMTKYKLVHMAKGCVLSR